METTDATTHKTERSVYVEAERGGRFRWDLTLMDDLDELDYRIVFTFSGERKVGRVANRMLKKWVREQGYKSNLRVITLRG